MKKLFLPLFLFCASAACAQTYQIPNAPQQPAWVFPVWFEDANGVRDTLYYGYDPRADSTLCCHGPWEYTKQDINFGEVWDSTFVVDSTFIFFDNKNLVPNFNISRVQVNNDRLWFWVHFNRAKTPFKLKWDVNLLYSDTLPYPSTSGTPVAHGLLSFLGVKYKDSSTIYSGDRPIMITDAPVIASPVASDSAVFYGEQQDSSYYYGYFTISFEKYTGIYIGLNEVAKNIESWRVYPNPFTSQIKIISDKNSGLQLKLSDVYGKLIEEITLNGASLTLNTEHLPAGLYFLSDKQGNTKRLIKL